MSHGTCFQRVISLASFKGPNGIFWKPTSIDTDTDSVFNSTLGFGLLLVSYPRHDSFQPEGSNKVRSYLGGMMAEQLGTGRIRETFITVRALDWPTCRKHLIIISLASHKAQWITLATPASLHRLFFFFFYRTPTRTIAL